MSQLWNSIPNELRRIILEEFCRSILSDYSEFDSNFQDNDTCLQLLSSGYHQPLTSYRNALLTCREFHDTIMKRVTCQVTTVPKLNQTRLPKNPSYATALRRLQYAKFKEYTSELPTQSPRWYWEIFRAKAILGNFWLNPHFKSRDFRNFDNLMYGTGELGQILVPCLMEPFVNKFKREDRVPYDIIVEKLNSDGKIYPLVFGIAGHTVLSHYGPMRYVFYDVQDFNFIEEGVSFAYNLDLVQIHRWSKRLDVVEGLPEDFHTAERGSWWLLLQTTTVSNRQWCFINYKEKRLHIGPSGRQAEWPEGLDYRKHQLWSRDG